MTSIKLLVIFFYTAALILQCFSVFYTFNFLPLVKNNLGRYLFLGLGLSLMIGRRFYPILDILHNEPIDFPDSVLAFLISLFLFIGIFGIRGILINLDKKNLLLEKISKIDHLTGALSKLETENLVQKEIKHSLTSKEPITFLVIDIDRFKNVNDQYGHLIGDKVLRKLSIFCQNFLREIDIFGRVGGEEFLIALPNTNGKDAFAVAERLRCGIESKICAHVLDQPIKITISIGIAVFDPATDTRSNVEKLMYHYMAHADRAMYRAKELGRNQTYIEQNCD